VGDRQKIVLNRAWAQRKRRELAKQLTGAKGAKVAQGEILIIDEERFSRVCSALLAMDGYVPVRYGIDVDGKFVDINHKYGLTVMSYPYCSSILENDSKINIPVIVLSDVISSSLISFIKKFESSFCMIKPLDFDKFKSIVSSVINYKLGKKGVFEIV
jgi:hypothetical protein